MKIKHGSKIINIPNVKKVSKFGEGIGLMFHRVDRCPAMLFEFNSPTKLKIHSFFVFFKFAAIWLDDKNRIIDKKIIKPFQLSISCKKPFYKLIEIPLNKAYKENIKFIFGKK